MQRRRKGILIRFRSVPRPVFGDGEAATNELWIGVDGPEDLRLTMAGSTAAPSFQPRPLTLTAPPPSSDLPPYALDILEGDGLLSVRGDEAEEAWRIIEPVARAWAEDRVALEEYPAGSGGPSSRTRVRTP